MNILFDQTEAQASFYNGAAEYAQALFLQMVSQLREYQRSTLFSLYSSKYKFKYKNLSPDALKGTERVIPIDYHHKNLKQIIKDEKIDLLFVSCAQNFCDLPLGDLRNLGCKVVIVIHDMYVEEMTTSRIEYLHYIKHPWTFVRNQLGRVKVRLLSGTTTPRAELMRRLIEENDSEIVTVSNYSKQSIEYYYPNLKDKIRVFYSPMKVCPDETDDISNPLLKNLINNKKKYFLLLSADRITKNGEKMLSAFRQYAENINPSAIIVTTGYKKSLFKQHVALPFLSSSDINNAYRHCHALLYPSVFEGFGYPPVEAMRYGKPVLSSQICSMPEILGDSPIYFSPLYESSMYGALKRFNDTPYEYLHERSNKQYKIIEKNQTDDLKKLSTMLLNGSFLKSKSYGQN